jgi:hypothetical protein
MKKRCLLLATMALLALTLPLTTNAAPEVYDLKTDWSDTQNPNGTWSYLEGERLMLADPVPWWGPSSVGTYIVLSPEGEVMVAPTGGGNILWTAPESGTIDISGATWGGSCYFDDGTYWTLSLNGSSLSGGKAGDVCSNPISSPLDLSSGSGGTAALQNISVQPGDQLVLAIGGFSTIGVKLTITLTPDSVGPVPAIENLAITVVEMNLQNGIENSLDSKLDAALNALVDATVNNDGAACSSLGAFIDAVEAQRGKQITSAQADQLIASAQQIKMMLNCGN